MSNPNVLSDRYVSPPMNFIFSREGRTITERELWIAVMEAEQELGVPIPAEDIAKFRAAINDFDFDFEREWEVNYRHDIKAKIAHFLKVSNAREHIHRPMTSRDLSDNVEQVQIKRACQIIFGKYVSVLRHMVDKSMLYRDIFLTTRTHNVPAQLSTFGRRFSMWAEELLYHLINFEFFINNYPLRGIKGPVGTQFDMLTLLGNKEKVEQLERIIAEKLGFSRILRATGQVYPRSLDFALVSQLALLSAACSSFSWTMRLMSGYELATEGFKPGQVGSTAMPYKMNSRTSERIHGFSDVLKTAADGLSRISGEQLQEGDVSCSVPRRVFIPDAFYTSDGVCEATLTVLNEMGAYPAIISREIDRYLPYLALTEILVLATKAGMGREEAHAIIRKYSIAEALKMRESGSSENQLAENLANDSAFIEAGITRESINQILSERTHFVGNALEQIDDVAEQARRLIGRYKEESEYEPLPIL